MSIRSKITMSVLCLGPLALWITYLFFSSFYGPQIEIGTIMIVGIAVGIILSIFLAVRFFMTKGIPFYKRYIWAMFLLFGNVIVLPCYWYFFVWKGNGSIVR